jgi:serine protease Do
MGGLILSGRVDGINGQSSMASRPGARSQSPRRASSSRGAFVGASKGRRAMRALLAAWFSLIVVATVPVSVTAQAPLVGDVFKKVIPSVAVIRARASDVSTRTGSVSRVKDAGSGVLISADGKVMTAAHVVQAMEEITVEFLGSAPVSGRVIASEPAADVSIIQLERVPPGARVASVADSSKVAIGDRVIVVGAPYGLSYSLSAGLISARYAPNTVYQAFPLAEFFQTDAAINTGNSGGPMFNMAGQVIGVVSHLISKSGGSEGLGFVVTINSARENLLQRRAFWSGLEVYPVTGPLADVLNLPPKAEGLMVKSVAKGSRAEEAGLRAGAMPATIDGREMVLGGDIILEVGPIVASGPDAYLKIRSYVNSLSPTTSFKIKLLRAGEVLETVSFPGK